MADALYGEDGFYRHSSASRHFRTSPHASTLFAAALRRLADEVDAALGQPDPFDIVDVGAGDGDLLHALAAAAPRRWRLTAVEMAPRINSRMRWRLDIPRCAGLLVANEWLDNVPCDVVERAADGLRLVRTDGSLGPPPAAADVEWLTRWWPLTAVGARAEVGRSRDEAWAAAVRQLDRGVAVAIDYAHERAARPSHGTLTGYRAGRQVPPVADGSCDLTAHVALDACAAAADVAGTLLTTQRRALRALGVRADRPAYGGDPLGYLAALSAAGEAAELCDPAGLGGFGWLVQSVGTALPAVFTATTSAGPGPARHLA
ncbi:MAG: SAM-dependent methyltransferase [Frankiaceae bacterium]